MLARSACFDRRSALAATIALALSSPACTRRGPPVFLEYAEVVPAGTEGAIELPSRGPWQETLHVLPPLRGEVESAGIHPGVTAQPSLAFTFVEHDEEAFDRWTAERLDRRMAVLLDGRMISVATIRSDFPGNGIIEFGANPPSQPELSRLVDRLNRR